MILKIDKKTIRSIQYISNINRNMTTPSHYLMKYGEVHNYTTFFGMALFRAFTLKRKTRQEEAAVSLMGNMMAGMLGGCKIDENKVMGDVTDLMAPESAVSKLSFSMYGFLWGATEGALINFAGYLMSFLFPVVYPCLEPAYLALPLYGCFRWFLKVVRIGW